jgi:proline iminopeptidase
MNWLSAFFLALAVPAQAADPAMVKLATGSEVATWTFPASGARRHAVPVLFLHGGPGLYTEARRFDEGAPLRAAGFDTIYFDQAGGGRSARLKASDYSLDRAVADVEALRIALGHEKLVLWGNSWGAALATLYASRHPGRVAGFVLTAPGMFPGFGGKRDYSRTDRDKVEYAKDVTAAVNRIDREGAAAEAALPQDRAGAIFDTMVAAELIDGVVCKGAGVKPPSLPGGGNLYVNRLISRDLKALKFKPAPLVKVPAIIVRGSCDFLSMASAERYAAVLGAPVITVAGAGHGLLEQRAAVDAALSNFAQGPLAGVK